MHRPLLSPWPLAIHTKMNLEFHSSAGNNQGGVTSSQNQPRPPTDLETSPSQTTSNNNQNSNNNEDESDESNESTSSNDSNNGGIETDPKKSGQDKKLTVNRKSKISELSS